LKNVELARVLDKRAKRTGGIEKTEVITSPRNKRQLEEPGDESKRKRDKVERSSFGELDGVLSSIF
jgi:hypothetical protein